MWCIVLLIVSFYGNIILIMQLNKFLQPDETIVDKIHSDSDNPDVDYSIFVLQRHGLKTGDEVLLEIRGSAEPCVLIGGNPLKLNILQGFGRLAILELATSEMRNIFLEVGDDVEVPTANTVYWYENMGDEPFAVRDHCDAFDPANEPRLSDLADVLIRL